MALQMDVDLHGGITHKSAYVRVRGVRVSKDGTKWTGYVEWDCYKDDVEAKKKGDGPGASPVGSRLPSQHVTANKFPYDPAGDNPIAQAYEWAKGQDIFVGAVDI